MGKRDLGKALMGIGIACDLICMVMVGPELDVEYYQFVTTAGTLTFLVGLLFTYFSPLTDEKKPDVDKSIKTPIPYNPQKTKLIGILTIMTRILILVSVIVAMFQNIQLIHDGYEDNASAFLGLLAQGVVIGGNIAIILSVAIRKKRIGCLGMILYAISSLLSVGVDIMYSKIYTNAPEGFYQRAIASCILQFIFAVILVVLLFLLDRKKKGMYGIMFGIIGVLWLVVPDAFQGVSIVSFIKGQRLLDTLLWITSFIFWGWFLYIGGEKEVQEGSNTETY